MVVSGLRLCRVTEENITSNGHKLSLPVETPCGRSELNLNLAVQITPTNMELCLFEVVKLLLKTNPKGGCSKLAGQNILAVDVYSR